MPEASAIPAEFQARCAVAGDLLDTRVATENGLVAEYEQSTYYFCCPPCKPTFLANPANYTGDKQAAVPLTFTGKEHIVDNVWSFHFAPSTAIEWQAGSICA